MKRWQKWGIAVIVLICMLGAQLVGYASWKKKEASDTLTLWIVPGRAEALLNSIEEKFPEIKLEVKYYCGANTTEFFCNAIRNDDTSDIVFCTVPVTGDMAKEHLLDLSSYRFLGKFDNGILADLEVDGHIYQITGPVSVRCILYNKTLFEQHGWKVPHSFDQLVETVRRIRQEEPQITPLALGTAAPGFAFSMVTSFSQCGFLSTPDGVAWEKRYLAGEASIEEGFDEGLTMMERLIDADAFEAERYRDEWNVVDGDMCERKVAMSMIMNSLQDVLPLLEGTMDPETDGAYCQDEFGILPFFGIEKGEEGLSLGLSSSWALSKRLGEPGNEKKLENAIRLMQYISTPEAQQLLKMDDGQIPALKEIPDTEISRQMADLWQLKQTGKKSFYLYSGYEDIMVEAGNLLIEYMKERNSEGMRENFVQLADQIHQTTIHGGENEASFGELTENLSVRQTGQLYMDAVQALGLSDFTMATFRGCEEGIVNENGVGGKLYAGEATSMGINVGLGKLGDTVHLIPMTGAQIKELLNTGKTLTGTPVGEEGEREHTFPYSWSGIEVTTWQNTITNIKLRGTPLSEEQVYVVAVLGTDYDQRMEQEYEIEDTKVLVANAVKSYLRANTPMKAPEVSGR